MSKVIGMQSAPMTTIWLCGNTSLDEFQPARRWLAERYALIEISAADAISDSTPLAIIDVRDTYSPTAAAHLERLSVQQPLALVLQFLGPWCDGMGRSPGFLPGVLRVAWNRWEAELPALLEPRSYLPRTATDADRIFAQSRRRTGQLQESIGIVAASRVTQESLVEAVIALGGKAVCLREPSDVPSANIDQLLIDLDGSRDQETWLEPWLAAAADKPVIVLAGFVRPDQVDEWKQRGIRAAIAKPYSLETLMSAIRAAANGTRDRSQCAAEAAP